MGVPREDGRITGLLWAHYRPKDNPDSVIIQHPKTHEAVACRSTLAKTLNLLERVKGIEPSSSAWKAVALPLSYTRIRTTENGRRRTDRRARCRPSVLRPLSSVV